MDPRIVAMLRIKNEERGIAKTLQSLSEICSEIVILDDGSTDDTVKICKKFDKVVDLHEQINLPTDQTRDKNILLKMALRLKPDFILTLDGDEIIQPKSKRILYDELNVLHPTAAVFEFQILYVWDKPNQYRYDGYYSNVWQRRLIRMSCQPQNLLFDETGYAENGHCPAIPQNSYGWNRSLRSKIKILHYGYYDERLRQTKYEYYNLRDGQDNVFDGYKHVISGEGKFSGTKGMEFKILPEGLFYKF